VVPKTVCDRIHDCPFCGHKADRDVNAAQVLLKRACGRMPCLQEIEWQNDRGITPVAYADGNVGSHNAAKEECCKETAGCSWKILKKTEWSEEIISDLRGKDVVIWKCRGCARLCDHTNRSIEELVASIKSNCPNAVVIEFKSLCLSGNVLHHASK